MEAREQNQHRHYNKDRDMEAREHQHRHYNKDRRHTRSKSGELFSLQRESDKTWDKNHIYIYYHEKSRLQKSK